MSFLAPPWESEPQAAKFVKTFNERYGDIKNYAPIAYDAAWILIKAIEKAGKPNRKAIIAVLRDPGFRHTGITGEARFDNKGDVIGRVPYIYVVRKGKLALIQ
jgi:branched-chain amino acid transport system substrate-binding protein